MIRDAKFLNKANWHEIKRGWIFEAAIPYTGERPLEFFLPDPGDDMRGTIKKNNGNFFAGEVQKVILGLKQRKVIVISNDDICSNNNFYDITVAPLYSIYESDKKVEWYKEAVEGSHLFFAYFPEKVTGRECVVDLSNIITINKNMLLSRKIDATDYIADIEKKMEYCLQLGVYKKQQAEQEEGAS